MTIVPTFTATIYVGSRVGRTADPNAAELPLDLAYDECQKYVNDVGLCVTVTPTRYLYKNGGESGVIVGLINYPRFPSSPEVIKQHAIALAERLKAVMKQQKVTIVMSGETIMLGDEPKE